MVTRQRLAWGAIAAAAAAAAGGCATSPPTVEFTYVIPAEQPLPAGARRAMVAPFADASPRERRWGPVVARKLGAGIAAAADRNDDDAPTTGLQLAAPTPTGAPADAVDLPSACAFGERFAAELVIYGRVEVKAGGAAVTSGAGQGSTWSLARVDFNVAHVPAERTALAVSVERRVAGAAPADQLAGGAVAECVARFLEMLTPRRVRAVEELRPTGAGSRRAHEHAAARRYAEALALYEKAIATDPTDHGALFDAGVMQEALGRRAEAARLYAGAYRFVAEPQYAAALARVRR
jgi:tetratricopeptide (TPR) repeat protein